MRAAPQVALLTAALLIAGCNPGVPPPAASNNQAESAPAAPPPPPANVAAPVAEGQPLSQPAPAAAEPPARDPGLAAMSPFRRREYERGYRDCMSGDFDRERQGESYRIGCMAAEEARERRAR